MSINVQASTYLRIESNRVQQFLHSTAFVNIVCCPHWILTVAFLLLNTGAQESMQHLGKIAVCALCVTCAYAGISSTTTQPEPTQKKPALKHRTSGSWWSWRSWSDHQMSGILRYPDEGVRFAYDQNRNERFTCQSFARMCHGNASQKHVYIKFVCICRLLSFLNKCHTTTSRFLPTGARRFIKR